MQAIDPNPQAKPSSDLAPILQTLEQSSDNRTHFDENWSQGRSAFGGLSASFAVTAMRKLLSTEQSLRSLMVSFVAPIPPGEINVEAEILRQGKNVTQTSARVIADGNVALQAMAAFGNPRAALEVSGDHEFKPRAKDTGISFIENQKNAPSFIRFFDGYWMSEGLPFSGQPVRDLKMWVKHQADMSSFPIEKIVTIADIPPPIILSHFSAAPVFGSSLSWSLEFVVPPETVESEWFYLEFELESAADGYTQQSGKIFTETGQLCALTRQTMVYFG